MTKFRYVGGNGAPKNDTLFGFPVKLGEVIDVDYEHVSHAIIARHDWFKEVGEATAANAAPTSSAKRADPDAVLPAASHVEDGADATDDVLNAFDSAQDGGDGPPVDEPVDEPEVAKSRRKHKGH